MGESSVSIIPNSSAIRISNYLSSKSEREYEKGERERGRVLRIQTRYNIHRIVQDVLCNNRRINNRTKMDTKEGSVKRAEDKEMVHKSVERREIRRRQKRKEKKTSKINKLYENKLITR